MIKRVIDIKPQYPPVLVVIMTQEKLLEEIALLKGEGIGDPEGCHIELDKLLLEYIGDGEVTKAFHEVEKWYA